MRSEATDWEEMPAVQQDRAAQTFVPRQAGSFMEYIKGM